MNMIEAVNRIYKPEALIKKKLPNNSAYDESLIKSVIDNCKDISFTKKKKFAQLMGLTIKQVNYILYTYESKK